MQHNLQVMSPRMFLPFKLQHSGGSVKSKSKKKRGYGSKRSTHDGVVDSEMKSEIDSKMSLEQIVDMQMDEPN